MIHIWRKETLCLLLILFFASYCHAQEQQTATSVQENVCLSVEELKLFEQLNAYRKSNGLTTVPLSRALCAVAQLHVKDLAEHYRVNSKCNLHSWSENGKWSACCYTPDHKEAQCMWDKPRELTDYVGDGYEIAFYTNQLEKLNAMTESALTQWKNSPAHLQVLINTNDFKEAQWHAMGVGIYKGFACVWFGMTADESPQPELCK